MTIEEYIYWIKTPGNLGGELAIYSVKNLHNINIVIYKLIFNLFLKNIEYIIYIIICKIMII